MYNSTIICPHCKKNIIPRGVHSYGKLVSTYCPICGETVIDFSPVGTKFIPAVIFGMMFIVIIVMYFGE